jgi:cytochrome P450
MPVARMSFSLVGRCDVSELEALDFFRDEAFVADPYPYYDEMRGKCPIRRESHHQVMMVTGYEEAAEILHDAERFSSCIAVTGPFPGFPVPLEGRDDVPELIEQYRAQLPMSDQLPTMDPPVHTAHRGLLMKLITPKRLKENESRMWELADQLLDEYLPSGEGEFINGFVQPYTLLVIADLLGVPADDQAAFRATLAQNQTGGGNVGSTTEHSLAHSPLEFLYQRFGEYIEDRRRNPRADVLTGLAQATFPDGSLPEVMDVVRVAANVFSAGQETTVRLISSGVKVLAEDPALQERLRAEPGRIPNFVEETLRYDGPIKGDFRMAKTDVTVGGVEIRAGQILMLVQGAANRDPRRFENPGEFDLDRENARHHMAFGRGIHTCPGAPLARAEGRAALERLLARTGEIRISDQMHGPAGERRYRYIPTFILRGLTHLGLEYTPAGQTFAGSGAAGKA